MFKSGFFLKKWQNLDKSLEILLFKRLFQYVLRINLTSFSIINLHNTSSGTTSLGKGYWFKIKDYKL